MMDENKLKNDLEQSMKTKVVDATVDKPNTVQPVLMPLKSNKTPVPGEQPNDLLLPVKSRMRKRLAVLKEESSAKTTKYQRGSAVQHVTIAPIMFIKELTPVLSNDNYGTITYGVYEKEGANKKANEVYETVDGKKRLVDSSYILDKTVVETFEYRKAGIVETFMEGDLR